MSVTFTDEQTRAVDGDALVDLAERVLRHEGYPATTELAITAVEDEVIAAMKGEYLGESAVTDVLSFPIEDFEPGQAPIRQSDGPPVMLGDVVIAPSHIARQALDHGVSELSELSLMVVHGILHLMGWDHVVDDEAEAMERREREILALVGVERR
ncbi:MAG TPA: rRNA maturation RNase YbeY [Acidimicrobiia bacterium]|nr:rRNA maturation RNase YbeY [Acidimicrobiia bacterium]